MRNTTHSTEQLLDTATEALREAVGRQARDADPAHEDFYIWGWVLTEVTDTLGQLCRTMAPQVARYGDTRVLRDDEGGDPFDRLREMRELLGSLYSQLELANATARAYHAAAGHVAVEVDPDTDPDGD
jgi:hypothetical protein